MVEKKIITGNVRRTQKDYSLAFKLQVVYEVEKGQLSYKEAQRKYGIQGRSTVLVWLRKHGSLDWQTNQMKGKRTPQQQIREMEKQIKRLEAEKLILNRAIDIADEMFDTNIRKKVLAPVRSSFQTAGAERGLVTTKLIASTLGYSRQYCYKQLLLLRDIVEQKQEVKRLINEQRKQLPYLGTRKLHYLIGPLLKQKGLKVGRDKLFAWMREYELLIKPRRRYVQTTNSKHWLRKYPNLVKDITVTAPEQVWVSDITYIKTEEGTCYLNLVTDAYSRKIVGYSIADSMEAEVMKKAYQMAINQRCYPERQLIHHSDRGLQYCSSEYVTLSVEANVLISMTENGDPYENALAERMNRTLKDEFGLGRRLPSKQQAFRLTEEAVYLYNNLRPHSSLNMKTPQIVHLQKSRLPEATGTI